MSKDFKYDAALSFVGGDQQLALQIADRVRDRMSTFVYTERQDVFAGTDGMEQHARIYGEESRTVIVLHRRDWGQTDWTRVEETVIRDRAFQKGWDFLVTVALDSSEKPIWLPKTRIWVDFSRYGIDSVASAIEAAVQSEGGTVRSESVVDYALRIERKANFRDRYETWRNSEEGVIAAKQEVGVLYDKLKDVALDVSRNSERFQMRCHVDDRGNCAVVCGESQVTLAWVLRASNNLHGAELRVRAIRQELDELFRTYKTNQLSFVTYQPDLDLNGNVGWREVEGERHFLTTLQLAEIWCKRLIETAAAISDNNENSSDNEFFFA